MYAEGVYAEGTYAEEAYVEEAYTERVYVEEATKHVLGKMPLFLGAQMLLFCPRTPSSCPRTARGMSWDVSSSQDTSHLCQIHGLASRAREKLAREGRKGS
jgi:hypothetical protein